MLCHGLLSALSLAYLFGLVHARPLLENDSDSPETGPVAASVCPARITSPAWISKRDMADLCDGKQCWTNDDGSDIFGSQSKPMTQLEANSGEPSTQGDEINFLSDAVTNSASSNTSPNTPTTGLIGMGILDVGTPGSSSDATSGTELEASSSYGRPSMGAACDNPPNTEDRDLYVVHYAVFLDGGKPEHAIIVSNVIIPLDRKYTGIIIGRRLPAYFKTEGPQIWLDENGGLIRVSQWSRKGWLHADPKEEALLFFESIAQVVRVSRRSTKDWVLRVFSALDGSGSTMWIPDVPIWPGSTFLKKD